MTFGGTRWVRDQLGVNGAVDTCSAAYAWGGYTGVAAQVALAFGTGGLTLAYDAIGAGVSAYDAYEAIQRGDYAAAALAAVGALPGVPGGARSASDAATAATRGGRAAEGAAETEASLLARANAARDAELDRLTGVRSADRPATVVGAYNFRTGEVAVGSSSRALRECAEACAVRSLGGQVSDIRFTQAMRPNGSGPPFRDVPVRAAYCEPAYGRGAFPDPLTRFQSDL